MSIIYIYLAFIDIDKTFLNKKLKLNPTLKFYSKIFLTLTDYSTHSLYNIHIM